MENNYMKQADQEAEKDYQLLLKRLGIVIILGLLAFGAVKFMEALPPKGIITDQYESEINLRTNDAVASKVTITYRFNINLDTLDAYSYGQYQENKAGFYKRLFYWQTAEKLKTAAFKMNFGQEDILSIYKNTVNETILENTPKGAEVLDVVIILEHEPRVIELLKKRKEAAQNVYEAEKAVADAQKKLLETLAKQHVH